MVSPLPGQRTAAYPTVSPLPLFHDIPLLASPSDFDESVVNLVHFSAAMIVEACVRCLRVILPDFESPSSMPEVMSARYRMCSTLANACQGLGYQGEIGYQTFLYSSVKEWRKLLMFLLEKLPREAVQAADEPTGEGEGGDGATYSCVCVPRRSQCAAESSHGHRAVLCPHVSVDSLSLQEAGDGMEQGPLEERGQQSVCLSDTILSGVVCVFCRKLVAHLTLYSTE